MKEGEKRENLKNGGGGVLVAKLVSVLKAIIRLKKILSSLCYS